MGKFMLNFNLQQKIELREKHTLWLGVGKGFFKLSFNP